MQNILIYAIVMIIILLPLFRAKKTAEVRSLKKHRERVKQNLAAFIPGYIGRECRIFLTDSTNLTGTPEAVSEGWITIRTKEEIQVINGGYISRIEPVKVKK